MCNTHEACVCVCVWDRIHTHIYIWADLPEPCLFTFRPPCQSCDDSSAVKRNTKTLYYEHQHSAEHHHSHYIEFTAHYMLLRNKWDTSHRVRSQIGRFFPQQQCLTAENEATLWWQRDELALAEPLLSNIWALAKRNRALIIYTGDHPDWKTAWKTTRELWAAGGSEGCSSTVFLLYLKNA